MLASGLIKPLAFLCQILPDLVISARPSTRKIFARIQGIELRKNRYSLLLNETNQGCPTCHTFYIEYKKEDG